MSTVIRPRDIKRLARVGITENDLSGLNRSSVSRAAQWAVRVLPLRFLGYAALAFFVSVAIGAKVYDLVMAARGGAVGREIANSLAWIALVYFTVLLTMLFYMAHDGLQRVFDPFFAFGQSCRDVIRLAGGRPATGQWARTNLERQIRSWYQAGDRCRLRKMSKRAKRLEDILAMKRLTPATQSEIAHIVRRSLLDAIYGRTVPELRVRRSSGGPRARAVLFVRNYASQIALTCLGALISALAAPVAGAIVGVFLSGGVPAGGAP